MSERVNESDAEVICCCFRKNPKEIKTVAPTETSSNAACNDTNLQFATELPTDLGVGTAISITAEVLPKCSRFVVELKSGRGLADIGFHLNPRLQQHYIVRNCRLDDHWGEEETLSPSKVLFEPGKKFVITLLMGDGEYMVSVDDVHICSYEFRLPLTRVRRVEVSGLVTVHGVDYKHLKSYPENPKHKTVTVAQGRRPDEDFTTETAMDTPVTFLLPRGLQRNWQLEIYGRVKMLPHSFYVNLQEGPHLWPHPIIPLHLNPRFGMGSGEAIFVRNSWLVGGWGQEERTPGFQFSPGSPFTMAIRHGNDHFSVWIDGKLAGEFKFRWGPDKIDTLHIQGDVVIYDVRLDDTTYTIVPTPVLDTTPSYDMTHGYDDIM